MLRDENQDTEKSEKKFQTFWQEIKPHIIKIIQNKIDQQSKRKKSPLNQIIRNKSILEI